MILTEKMKKINKIMFKKVLARINLIATLDKLNLNMGRIKNSKKVKKWLNNWTSSKLNRKREERN